VIVGDQNQLGPTVSSETLEKAKGYDLSLFERMIKNNFPYFLLDTQFRMHPAISAFPSKQFYNGQIKDGITAEDRTCEPFPFFLSKSTPIVFYDIAGKEETSAGDLSFSNENEANAVAKIIQMMIQRGITDKKIGVISPYRGQVSLLRKKIHPFLHQALKIATIDSFQGSERDFIIFSCVRTERLGFLEDWRRLNVALTRARCGLVIVGCKNALNKYSHSPGTMSWHALIDHFEKEKAVVTEIPDFKVERPISPPAIVNTRRTICVKSSVSQGDLRVIWPEDRESVDFLKKWVGDRVKRLNRGENVTIAFDTESVCVQVGEIFNQNFDPIKAGKEIPPVGSSEGVIVFCFKKIGEKDCSACLELGPLFKNDRVTIATFDFTNDLEKLEKMGIAVNTSRMFDAQLVDTKPLHEKLLEMTAVPSLVKMVQRLSDADELARHAKSHLEEKFFSFKHVHFVMSVKKLLPTAIVTQQWIEYAANDVVLTGLVFAEALRSGQGPKILELTAEKLKEVRAAETEYGSAGVLRQKCFVKPKLSLMTNTCLDIVSDSYEMLQHWDWWQKIVTIFENSGGKLDLYPKESLEEKKKRVATLEEKIQNEFFEEICALAPINTDMAMQTNENP
jgi:hypothetical protein